MKMIFPCLPLLVFLATSPSSHYCARKKGKWAQNETFLRRIIIILYDVKKYK
jgi:hypothetical protein